MLYSLVECVDGELKQDDYNDWGEVIRIATAKTIANAFDFKYWCKVYIYKNDGKIEGFSSKDYWLLCKLYQDKSKIDKKLASEWLRDEIYQFNRYKIKAYLKYLESINA